MHELLTVGLEPSHLGVGITESFNSFEIKTPKGIRNISLKRISKSHI
jgi:hypothetical protein